MVGEVTGVADNTTSIDDKLTAVEAKYVDDWVTSLRNPASEMGEQAMGCGRATANDTTGQKYSQYFPGGIVYHTNSVDFAAYYTKVFQKIRRHKLSLRDNPCNKDEQKYGKKLYGAHFRRGRVR